MNEYEQQDIEETNSWRQNWFVKNVLVEIPIIGSFFKKKTLPKAAFAAGKCAAALVGSTAAMMTILVPEETDGMATMACKSAASMSIGMTVAKVTYNGAYQGISMLYNYHSSRIRMTAQSGSESEIELNPIMPSP